MSYKVMAESVHYNVFILIPLNESFKLKKLKRMEGHKCTTVQWVMNFLYIFVFA